MTAGGVAMGDTRASRGFRLPTEAWAIDAARLRHMTETLDDLPIGFAVFHSVALPKPATDVIDHIVIGPRSIWAITAATFEEPVTTGSGRGADTLWAGRTPLRSVLEACESRADALTALIGHPVEPLLCISAPSISPGAAETQGVSVCSPAELADTVARPTTSWHDVNDMSALVEAALQVQSARRSAVPQLHRPTLPPTQRGSTPASRIGQWPKRVRRHLPVRRVVPIAALVVALTAVPNLFGMGSSVAQRGVEIGVESVSDVLTPSTLVTEAAAREPIGSPPAAGYVVSCPTPGSGWAVTWVWPGELPDGAASYGIRMRRSGARSRDLTPTPWSSSTQAPPTARIDTSDGDVTLVTEYRDEAGAIAGTTSELFAAPSGSC